MKVKIEIKKSCIYIQLRGEFIPDDKRHLAESKRIVLKAFNEAKKNQIFKLLFDARTVSTDLSIINRYQLMMSLATVYINYILKYHIRPLKTAITLNKALIDPQKFDEIVARNRGMNMLITHDLEEALKWLAVEPYQ